MVEDKEHYELLKNIADGLFKDNYLISREFLQKIVQASLFDKNDAWERRAFEKAYLYLFSSNINDIFWILSGAEVDGDCCWLSHPQLLEGIYAMRKEVSKIKNYLKENQLPEHYKVMP